MSRYLSLLVVAAIVSGWSEQRIAVANANEPLSVKPAVLVKEQNSPVQANTVAYIHGYGGYRGYGGYPGYGGYYGHAGYRGYHPYGYGFSRPYYGGNYGYGPAFYSQYGYYYPGVTNAYSYPVYGGYTPYSYGYTAYPGYVW